MTSIIQISDYIIFRCKAEGDTDLSTLKHQKLLYYVQAWHRAFHRTDAFESDFQAWIHGPVNREIYDLYKGSKYLYTEMTIEDIQDNEIVDHLEENLKIHTDSILEAYAKFSDTELELMTHQEEPWIEARKGYRPNQRCEVVISNETMERYYAARLS